MVRSLPSELFAGWGCSGSRTRWARPLAAGSRGGLLPPCRAERHARLSIERVSDEASVSESPRRAPCCGIKQGAGVPRAIRAASCDLRRMAVVQMARHGAADGDDAMNSARVTDHGHAKAPSLRREMVAMMLGDVGFRGSERNWLKGESKGSRGVAPGLTGTGHGQAPFGPRRARYCVMASSSTELYERPSDCARN